MLDTVQGLFLYFSSNKTRVLIVAKNLLVLLIFKEVISYMLIQLVKTMFL